MNRKKNATRNISWGIINKILMLGMPFVFRTALIRILGAEYLGLGGLFNSILHILNMTELGFGSAVMYSLYKPVAEKNTEEICALMNEYRRIYKIVGTVIAVIGIIIMPFLPRLINGDTPADINIYFLYLIYLTNTVLSYWLFAYKSVLLEVHQRNDISTNIQSAGFIIQYILQLYVLLLYKNYYIYIIWVPIFTIVRNLIISYIVDKRYPEYKSNGRISDESRDLLKKRVSGLLIQKVCAATRNSFDSIVISSLLGLSVVAEYGNYYYVISALHGLLDVIIVSIRPVVGNSIALETKEKNYRDFNIFNYLFGGISTIATICLLSLYQPFIKMWVGQNLVFSNQIMILFCIYFYSLTIIDVRTLYDDAAGLWWYGKKIVIIESILNVILNILMGYIFGVTGIIVATIISIVLINMLLKSRILFHYYFDSYSVREYYFFQGKNALIAVISSAFIYYIINLIPSDDFLGLIIKGGICLCISTLVISIIYSRDEEKWEYFMKLLRDICNTLFGKEKG